VDARDAGLGGGLDQAEEAQTGQQDSDADTRTAQLLAREQMEEQERECNAAPKDQA
jgi:hypothetical protein